MEPVYQLIYISEADPALDAEDLARLEEEARKANTREDVTGVLVLEEGEFLQVLEGERQTVERLFERIRKDPRHHHVRCLYRGSRPQREFDDWSMRREQPKRATPRGDAVADADAGGALRFMRDHSVRRELMRRCMTLAEEALEIGEAPYAAMVVDRRGEVLAEAINTVRSSHRSSRHAEINAIEQAQETLGRRDLNGLILYASAEPCPMCCGAIYWSGIRELVFGVSVERLREQAAAGNSQMRLDAASLLRTAPEPLRIHGPMMQERGLKPHL